MLVAELKVLSCYVCLIAKWLNWAKVVLVAYSSLVREFFL